MPSFWDLSLNELSLSDERAEKVHEAFFGCFDAKIVRVYKTRK